MASRLNPYISFKDNAREAMEFYQSVFGGELNVMTFGQAGMSEDPAERELVMHATLSTPQGYTLMGADTPASMGYQPPSGAGITISLSGDADAEELRGFWDKLADGGSVTVPLAEAPWGDTFGMCTDRFGVGWMVDIGA